MPRTATGKRQDMFSDTDQNQIPISFAFDFVLRVLASVVFMIITHHDLAGLCQHHSLLISTLSGGLKSSIYTRSRASRQQIGREHVNATLRNPVNLFLLSAVFQGAAATTRGQSCACASLAVVQLANLPFGSHLWYCVPAGAMGRRRQTQLMGRRGGHLVCQDNRGLRCSPSRRSERGHGWDCTLRKACGGTRGRICGLLVVLTGGIER